VEARRSCGATGRSSVPASRASAFARASFGRSWRRDERTPDEEHRHERHVDDRHRGPEEVVVVSRHELADLVHERPEAQARDDRRDGAGPTGRGKASRSMRRGEHQESRPRACARCGSVPATAVARGRRGKRGSRERKRPRRRGSSRAARRLGVAHPPARRRLAITSRIAPGRPVAPSGLRTVVPGDGAPGALCVRCRGRAAERTYHDPRRLNRQPAGPSRRVAGHGMRR